MNDKQRIERVRISIKEYLTFAKIGVKFKPVTLTRKEVEAGRPKTAIDYIL